MFVRKIAAVVQRTKRRPIRHGVRIDQVASAQVDAIDVQFTCSNLDNIFDQVAGFRPTGLRADHVCCMMFGHHEVFITLL
jgi:hypothetical protein